MLDRTKSILVNAAICAVLALLFFAVNVQVRQWTQFNRGENARAAGDPVNAIAGYESAIHMYTPLSPLVEKSAARLWDLGNELQARGEVDRALIAFRALRSAFYSTHGLTSPGTDWIARCDEKIRQLARPGLPAQ